MASVNRAWSSMVDGATSSRAIMMSLPMRFWWWMESSGFSSIC
jgi:hypothetical protein